VTGVILVGATVLLKWSFASPYLTDRIAQWTLHPTPTPYTLHPTHCNPHPTPYTLQLSPHTLHPTPRTL